MQSKELYALFYFSLESICFLWFLFSTIREFQTYFKNQQLSELQLPLYTDDESSNVDIDDYNRSKIKLVHESSSHTQNTDDIQNPNHSNNQSNKPYICGAGKPKTSIYSLNSLISDTSADSTNISRTPLVTETDNVKSNGVGVGIWYILLSVIKIICWSFTLFISLFMQLNKVQYRFTERDIGFVNEGNFSFYNNAYKVLSLFALCYLWYLSIVYKGTQHGISHLFEKSKFYSFDRLEIIALIAFLVSYDLMYAYFVKDLKWDKDLDAASAVLYYNLFCIVAVCLSLSLDFDLYDLYCQSHIELSTELLIFRLLLSNIIIAIQYNILVFIIESKSLLEDANLFITTFWSVYAFFNNYLLFGLIKIFGRKLIFHNRSIKPYKPRSIHKIQ